MFYLADKYSEQINQVLVTTGPYASCYKTWN